MIKGHPLVAILVSAFVLSCVPFAFAADLYIVDPQGLSDPVNSLGETMDAEVGNYTISQFNSNVETFNFTFDVADGFGPQMDKLKNVTLTELNSGINCSVDFIKGGTGGYGWVIDDWMPTGGIESCVTGGVVATHSVLFDCNIQGVGEYRISTVLFPRKVQVSEENDRMVLQDRYH